MNLFKSFRAKCIAFCFVMPAVGGGAYCGYLQTSGNFHAVLVGEAYRSAQLNHDEFVHYIYKYGIKSILNLRGTNKGTDWYEGERAATQKLHINLLDYGISANKEVSDNDLEALMQIIRDAPKPILIHCKAGADRSGLLAALYLYSRGRSAEESSQQLSVTYGHISFWSSTQAMDRTFWRYVSAHTPARLTTKRSYALNK